MQSGYKGKDSMRDLANRLLGGNKSSPDSYPAAPFENEQQQPMRKYRLGGHVKEDQEDKKEDSDLYRTFAPMKYAIGGSAKVRQGICDKKGDQKSMKRKPY